MSENIKEMTSTVVSYYGTGYGWGGRGDYGTNNNNNNAIYIGKDTSNYRSKLQFTIPSNIVISSASKIVIKLGKHNVDNFYRSSRGFLSAQSLSSSDYSGITSLGDRIKSYFYKDSEGTQRIPTDRYTKYTEDAYLVFKLGSMKVQPGQTLYVYLLPYASDSAADDAPTFEGVWCAWYNNPSGASSGNRCIIPTLYYTSYTKLGNPTSPSITRNNDYRTGAVTVKWGTAAAGAGGVNVSKYRVYYNTSNSVNSSKYKDVSSGSRSVILNNTSYANGVKNQTCYFWVQAISNISGYNSSIVGAGSYKIINSTPAVPSFETSGTIRSTGNTSITIRNLNSSDADGDRLSFYYNTSSNGTASSNWIAMPSNKIISMSADKPYLHIKVSDGAANSYKRVKIPVNIKPLIKQIYVSGEQFLSYSGKKSLIKNISLSTSINKNVSKYSWSITLQKDSAGGIWTSPQRWTTPQVQLDVQAIAGLVREGWQIQVSLTVTDDLGEQDSKDFFSNLYVLPKISTNQLSLTLEQTKLDGDRQIIDDLSNTRGDFFINDSLVYEWNSVKANRQDQSPFSRFRIWDAKTKAQIYEKAVQGASTITGTFSFDMPRDYSASFMATIYDEAGQSIDLPISGTFYRLPVPLFGAQDQQGNFEINNWNCYDSKEINFSLPYVNPYPGDLNGGKINYEVRVKIADSSKSKTLLEFNDKYPSDITGNTLKYGYQTSSYITVSQNGKTFQTGISTQIFDLFKNLELPTGKDYSVEYIITAKNNLGDFDPSRGVAVIPGKKIEATSAPRFYWPDERNKIAYPYHGVKIGSEVFAEAESFSGTASPRVINPKETITLNFSGYFWSREQWSYNGPKSSAQWLEEYSLPLYFNFITEQKRTYIIKGNVLNRVGKNSSFTLEIPYEWQGQIGTMSIFGLDKNGKKAIFKEGTGIESFDFEGTKIQIGIAREPDIEVQSIKKVEDGSGFNVTFLVNKSGGIDTAGRYGTNFLDSNPKIQKRSPRAIIYYESTKDPIFTESTKKEISSLSECLKQNTFTIKIPVVSSDTKVYFSFKISFETTCEGGPVVTTTIPTYIFFDEAPTVSYRAHWIGINNQSRQKDEVLRIGSFSGANQVTLVGEKEVTINLDTAKIDGIIIDCGGW